MWCHERIRLRPVVGLVATLHALFGSVTGSAAAAPEATPNLKVSGRASFAAEARASGDRFEVRATLCDEVGRPIPGAEVRLRAVSTDAAPTLHRCGDARGEAGGELLLTTDKSGRLCSSVTGMAAGSVELSFRDARGYVEPASLVVRLPDGVATSYEVGFDPALARLSLDQPVQEIGLVARGQAGVPDPAGAELVLSLFAEGVEHELGRAALDGLGEVHRFSLMSSSLGRPGPARVLGRLQSRGGAELAQSSGALMRSVTVALRVDPALAQGVAPGAMLAVRVASVLGPVPSGVVEARSRGRSVAAAPVRDGLATLLLPSAASLLGSALTLDYAGEGPGWLAGPPVELRVLTVAPGYARYALWTAAAALAALAVVLGWRRPPRARPRLDTPAPRPRASVEVLETFAAGGGYQGVVRDAHDATGISPAAVTFLGPGPRRLVLLQVPTAQGGSFRVDSGGFPAGSLVEITAPFHATLTAPLPAPGVLQLSLVSRRRALMERLVRWAERHGKPWTPAKGEPTPAQVAAVASKEAEGEVERWARGVERLAFGPTPTDAASEQASGVSADPKTARERGID